MFAYVREREGGGGVCVWGWGIGERESARASIPCHWHSTSHTRREENVSPKVEAQGTHTFHDTSRACQFAMSPPGRAVRHGGGARGQAGAHAQAGD